MKYLLFLPVFFITFFAQSQTDYILFNGKIFTSDKKNLWTEAIAIKGERVLATGKNEDILKLKSPQTIVIDINGRLVIPGINDAHNHVGPVYPALRFSITEDPTAPTPWEILKDSILRIVKTIPAGTFIITSIHPDLLQDQRVSRNSLDSIAPNHPILLSAWTGHGKIMNSAALRFLEFNEQSIFLGGKLHKYSNGLLNGIADEYASYQVGYRLSNKLSEEKIRSGLAVFYQQAAALGITSVQNMCTQLSVQNTISVYTKNKFSCRVRLIAFPFTNENELLLRDWDEHFHRLNAMNEISGIKLILDGTPIERLACMRQPYSDAPNQYGRLNFTESTLKKYMRFSLAHHQQIIIHAVGDSSIVTIIRSMRDLHPDAFWKDKRVRIEHAELAIINKEDIKTLQQLGIVIVQNPTHLALPKLMGERLGADRGKYAQAMRSLIDNDIVLAIGSDGPDNPFLNIMLATFHPDNPKEAISLQEAIIAYTHGSAYAEFKEKEKGLLAKGMLADLAVLSQDIFLVPSRQLPATSSILTFVGGKIVYNKNELKEIK
jgi:predicted amidohydrolase YtcJ